MPDPDAERTEEPSQRKIEESRERGEVGKSMDLNAAAILLASLLALYFMGPQLKDHLAAGLREIYDGAFGTPHRDGIPSFAGSDGDIFGLDDAQAFTRTIIVWVAKVFGPFFLILAAAGLLVSVFQVGFLFTSKPVELDLNKINPINGLKGIFSTRGLVRLITSIVKIIVVGVVVYYAIQFDLDRICGLSHVDPEGIYDYGCWLTFKVGLFAALALLILGIADYSYNKWQHHQDLRMTKEEVKDELKNYEGNPQVKARRRRAMQEMARQRMMGQVPKADVVITNPEHFAIAILYDSEEMDAPTVIAKGQDYMAQKIKEVARENKITILENPPLARELYKACKIGDKVPEKHFKAVAEILVAVYSADRRLRHKMKKEMAA